MGRYIMMIFHESKMIKKNIDGREIISLISIFDYKIFPKDSQPISAYSSKESTLNKYLKIHKNSDESNNDFELSKEEQDKIKTIFNLYNRIETSFNSMVKENNLVYK